MPLVYSKRKGAVPFPRNAVLVDRTTRWGNPFIVGRDGMRGECVRLYNEWIEAPGRATLRYEVKLLLKGKDLICWCCTNPKGPYDLPLICHGQILVRIANS
jgi:Domain of unknown function (DUF4326)